MQIKSYLKTGQQYCEVTLFGYTSKGLPGIEITGIGKWGSELRQKIIYFSKIHGINLPMLKYQLCCSLPWDAREMKKLDLTSLELPLVLMTWSLAQKIPLIVDEKTYTMGKIKLPNTIEVDEVNEVIDRNNTWIGLPLKNTRERYIDIQGVTQHIPSIQFRYLGKN